MVKRGGGTKRKPEMKKVTDKASRATTFSKRRDGLYSKAAQLCVLSDAQIAILTTPSSSNSNASFFSFGHSSVESVVSAAYLSEKRLPPVSTSGDTKAMREDIGICMARKDLGLGFWWNDEKLLNTKNREELTEAMGSMEVLMNHVKALKDQTLTTTVEEEDKVDQISPELDLDEWSEMELNQLFHDCDDDAPVPPPPVVVVHDNEEEEDQTVSVKTCYNNNHNFASLSETEERSLEEGWRNIDWETILQDCDFVPPPPPVVVSNTHGNEEENQSQYEETFNNFASLPVQAAGISLEEEEAMDIDWGTIFVFDN